MKSCLWPRNRFWRFRRIFVMKCGQRVFPFWAVVHVLCVETRKTVMNPMRRRQRSWKIVAKAAERDKKATHAANSFPVCFTQPTSRAWTRSRHRGQLSLISFIREVHYPQYICQIWNIARQDLPHMSSGSLKSRLKETRSATIDSESALLANVQVVFPVPHSSFRETARDLNPREKSRKVENVFPLGNFGSRVVSI